MKYPPHEMLDTVPTDTALNIFLNGLHDCHDSHCFIMSLLQRVMQKSKKCIVTPQDTPPDTRLVVGGG